MMSEILGTYGSLEEEQQPSIFLFPKFMDQTSF